MTKPPVRRWTSKQSRPTRGNQGFDRIDVFRESSKFRLKEGFRSPLEAKGADQLTSEGISWTYESVKVPYTVPERAATYNPDFLIGPAGGKQIILEFKGWPFEADDRQKMILVRDQHPELDIRFVFQNAIQKIYSGSKTTVAAWATQQGFQWADKGIVPTAWLNEVRT